MSHIQPESLSNAILSDVAVQSNVVKNDAISESMLSGSLMTPKQLQKLCRGEWDEKRPTVHWKWGSRGIYESTILPFEWWNRVGGI